MLFILKKSHALLDAPIFNFLKCLYSKTSLKRPLKKEDQKLVFKTNYRLMQVKSIAECSTGSILQYFRPSLSYHLPLRPLFGLFLLYSLEWTNAGIAFIFLMVNLFLHSSGH